MNPLTKEQQEFAEEHHNTVYAFLRKHKLPVHDYYDIAVFGYLAAVQQYLERRDLLEKYSFTTIAYIQMMARVHNHWRYGERSMRKGYIVSLETINPDADDILLVEALSDGQLSLEKQYELKEEIAEFLSLLTGEEKTALQLQYLGYSAKESAGILKKSHITVNNQIALARKRIRRQKLMEEFE
ncbi:MAG: hypothetical protein LBS36_06655 [Oscillospiraceae bacterium]|nr:hypothetical protein [Oscillospiraceae bacterium]